MIVWSRKIFIDSHMVSSTWGEHAEERGEISNQLACLSGKSTAGCIQMHPAANGDIYYRYGYTPTSGFIVRAWVKGETNFIHFWGYWDKSELFL